MTRLLTRPRRPLDRAPTQRLVEPKAKPKASKPSPPSWFNPFYTPCELQAFDRDFECEGVAVRCHLIKEQWLLNTLDLDLEEAWHPDFWIPGCNGVATPHGGHHWRFDHGKLKLTRLDIARLRPGLEERARKDERLAFKLERLYGALPVIGSAA